MRIVQLSPSMGQLCGVAVFADSMARALGRAGAVVQTVAEVTGPVDADLLLVQYHHELTTQEQLADAVATAGRPTVVVAHSPGLDGLTDRLAATMTMADGLLPPGSRTPNLAFTHPAYTPPGPPDRRAARRRLGLPLHERILASSGFLRFDREFPTLLSHLLPHAQRLGWTVLLVTSPWLRDSPGELEAIAAVGDKYPGVLRHRHEHLSEEMLNAHLTAADLLWCWSRPSPEPYASGVVSQMYGSGTRIVAADLPQHADVLRLPNVVRAPVEGAAFAAQVAREMAAGRTAAHDPSPVSWDAAARRILTFLRRVHPLRRG